MDKGVRLLACYGATEFGLVTCVFDDGVEEPSPIGKKRADWEWMQLPRECMSLGSSGRRDIRAADVGACQNVTM